MPRGATCSLTSKAISIVGGSTQRSAISPQSRQTAKPHNLVSTFPGEGQTYRDAAVAAGTEACHRAERTPVLATHGGNSHRRREAVIPQPLRLQATPSLLVFLLEAARQQLAAAFKDRISCSGKMRVHALQVAYDVEVKPATFHIIRARIFTLKNRCRRASFEGTKNFLFAN